MHVNDLPDEVLALVFQAAMPVFKRQLADAKSGLGLLSVCRRWREIALPMVYDTVVVKCSTEGTKGIDRPENVDVKTTLDLVVDAKCLHMVRRVVIDVYYWTNPFPGLKVAIERMRGAAGEWAGVRKLVLGGNAWGSRGRELIRPAADYEDEISSVSNALAALMPGLRELEFDDSSQTPIAGVLYGQLAGLYADQLQVLHSKSPLVVPQDRVFARLRDVRIIVFFYESLGGQLPRLDPEVVESLVLWGLTANDMWSMFCADPDVCAITFPRLTNLDMRYQLRSMMNPERLSHERRWALQFPAAKRVRISCGDEACPSMENAVFPNRLESLDIFGCLGVLSVFARRKVHVSRNLAISVASESDMSNSGIGIANRLLEAADSCRSRRLAIGGMGAISPELITYTGLTHLQLNGLMTADDVMQLICGQRHLVRLHVYGVNPDDMQTDFSIPECAEHEPVAPLDTQLRELVFKDGYVPITTNLTFSMLKYLLLRSPTLKSVTAQFVPRERVQTFIDKYIQWYPHLANIKLME